MDKKLIQEPSSPNQDYGPLAAHYDQFTAHHDYETWIRLLLPELQRWDLRGKRMLDLGSGTGKSLAPMLERGWKVTACDRSTAMLEKLGQKFEDRVAIAAADARRLPRLGEFDLVLSLGDVLNYVAAEGPIDGCLAGIRANLGPGGLTLFDLSTLATYRGVYATSYDMPVEGHTLRWSGNGKETTQPGEIVKTNIEIVDARSKTAETSVHRQRHIPESEIRSALDRAGLECLDLFGHDQAVAIGRPLDESRHTKAICIARLSDNKEERR